MTTDTQTLINLLRNCDRSQGNAKLMDDAAARLEQLSEYVEGLHIQIEEDLKWRANRSNG